MLKAFAFSGAFHIFSFVRDAPSKLNNNCLANEDLLEVKPSTY